MIPAVTTLARSPWTAGVEKATSDSSLVRARTRAKSRRRASAYRRQRRILVGGAPRVGHSPSPSSPPRRALPARVKRLLLLACLLVPRLVSPARSPIIQRQLAAPSPGCPRFEHAKTSLCLPFLGLALHCKFSHRHDTNTQQGVYHHILHFILLSKAYTGARHIPSRHCPTNTCSALRFSLLFLRSGRPFQERRAISSFNLSRPDIGKVLLIRSSLHSNATYHSFLARLIPNGTNIVPDRALAVHSFRQPHVQSHRTRTCTSHVHRPISDLPHILFGRTASFAAVRNSLLSAVCSSSAAFVWFPSDDNQDS